LRRKIQRTEKLARKAGSAGELIRKGELGYRSEKKKTMMGKEKKIPSGGGTLHHLAPADQDLTSRGERRGYSKTQENNDSANNSRNHWALNNTDEFAIQPAQGGDYRTSKSKKRTLCRRLTGLKGNFSPWNTGGFEREGGETSNARGGERKRGSDCLPQTHLKDKKKKGRT